MTSDEWEHTEQYRRWVVYACWVACLGIAISLALLVAHWVVVAALSNPACAINGSVLC